MNDLETLLDQRYQILKPAEIPNAKPEVEIPDTELPDLALYKPTGALVVIKRADYLSPQFAEQVRSLKTEILVLRSLADTNVPQIIDIGEKRLQINPEEYVQVPYVALEYVSGDRVSKIINSLSLIERLDILIQLFECLDLAHSRQIVNGDIDLLHLYWIRDIAHLTIIDWGNARINVTEAEFFAFDLAKIAEIAYSLLTLNTHFSFRNDPKGLPKETPSILQRFIEWGSENHLRLTDFTSIDPLLTASRLKQAAQTWKSKLLMEDTKDILGFKLAFQNSTDIAGFSSLFNRILEAVGHIYSVFALLLMSIPTINEKLLTELRIDSNSRISSLLLNENQRPQIITLHYGSPVSVDLLGIGKVCEIVRDLVVDISWRAKHQKQLAELERAGKQVEIRQAKLIADKTASELAAQRLDLEKASLDIALQKIELILKINQMPLSEDERSMIAKSLVPTMVFLSSNTTAVTLKSEVIAAQREAGQ